MQLEIDVAGDVQLSRRILRIGERAIHARPAFEAIAQMLFGIEREQFASEGAYASGGWEQLLDTTTGHKILHDTGALERSLTEPGGDNIKLVEDDFLVFGTSDPKAKYHQKGTGGLAGQDRRGEGGGKGLPRRRPLELRADNRSEIVKVLQRYIVRGEIAHSDGSTFSQVASHLA